MQLLSPAVPTCASDCQATTSIETLNRSCFCISLDQSELRKQLEADLGLLGLPEAMLETHPHLFAAVPMFVSREHLQAMAGVVAAVEAVVATPHYSQTVLAWAPENAQFDPGPAGGLLGFDFHLGPAGPQLIEINTNPGGALLNTVLARAHRSCCAEVGGLAMEPMEADAVEQALFELFLTEWRLQRTDGAPSVLAIVDERPEQQYLYPEFLLYRELLKRHGIEALVCDPGELVRRAGRLWHGDQPIDFVYNRLTDFALEQPAQATLQQAYLAGEVVVSPHPRAHALYADKRNLTLLCDPAFLRATGVAASAAAALLAGIPRTEIMTPDNRDALWARRRQLFFKPAAGYGSKAAYRGDKLTRRVWEEMALGSYVAQALVAPSERSVAGTPEATSLKADLRCYAYAGQVMLVAARLYQGQTTNFRTPGGGFAPVFTQAEVSDASQ
ncbi:MAG: hypothetical protein LH617_13985 [Ramlibacter sp.]|nr:hypothetical protein [Ramlibacter sp.]